MPWNPTTLRLDTVTPKSAAAGSRIVLNGNGVGFASGIQLLLVAPELPKSNQIAPGYEVKVTQGDSALKAHLILENLEPGLYDVIVWNPPIKGHFGNDVSLLEKAFEVTKG